MIARMSHANYKTQSRTVTSHFCKIQQISRLAGCENRGHPVIISP